MAERIFGKTITNSNGRLVPIRYIGEQHVREDLGRIPTLAEWLMCIKPQTWMRGRVKDLESALAEAPVKKAQQKPVRNKK